jgi:hypothetical protein
MLTSSVKLGRINCSNNRAGLARERERGEKALRGFRERHYNGGGVKETKFVVLKVPRQC